jgi:hypothetical protein
MKMEKNGRNSCTGNSRHINISYFFIKDQVDQKRLEIVYCPTEEMLADYFTKPLQGALFHKFREVIMGWKHINTFKSSVPSPSKERVGDTNESSPVTGPGKNPPRTYAQVLKSGSHTLVSSDKKHSKQK